MSWFSLSEKEIKEREQNVKINKTLDMIKELLTTYRPQIITEYPEFDGNYVLFRLELECCFMKVSLSSKQTLDVSTYLGIGKESTIFRKQFQITTDHSDLAAYLLASVNIMEKFIAKQREIKNTQFEKEHIRKQIRTKQYEEEILNSISNKEII